MDNKLQAGNSMPRLNGLLLYDVVPRRTEGPSEAEKKLTALTQQLENELFLSESTDRDHQPTSFHNSANNISVSPTNNKLLGKEKYHSPSTQRQRGDDCKDGSSFEKRTGYGSSEGDSSKTLSDLISKDESGCGYCFGCGNKILNHSEACQAIGRLYHSTCFKCSSCGRTLRAKAFYIFQEKIYCEEDYLNSGFQESADRCDGCGHIITDQILQATGRSYHPGCFCCCICKKGLDGISFTIDSDNNVYCVDDYHKLYAPRCAACGEVITPVEGTEETVRVVSMDKDFHIDCYHCEDCGMQLTDEPDKRCYPIGDHLFCYTCRLHRTSRESRESYQQNLHRRIDH